jgi:hypothetical protein
MLAQNSILPGKTPMSDESDDDVGSSLVESIGEESSSGGIHNWPIVMAIGAIIGLLLLLLTSVGLLFLEHKAITTAASLEQGVANVQTVSAEKVDPANNDKVVHLTGEATTNDTVTDIRRLHPQRRQRQGRRIHPCAEAGGTHSRQGTLPADRRHAGQAAR